MLCVKLCVNLSQNAVFGTVCDLIRNAVCELIGNAVCECIMKFLCDAMCEPIRNAVCYAVCEHSGKRCVWCCL